MFEEEAVPSALAVPAPAPTAPAVPAPAPSVPSAPTTPAPSVPSAPTAPAPATQPERLDPLCPNRQAGQPAVWCFQCGADYSAGVTNCLECGVATLPYPPTPVTKVGAENEQQMVYDLHEWSWESRSLMASYMFTEGLVHAWQGASLVVRETDEAQVDALVARVKETELPVLDHAAGVVEYELDELSDAQTDALTGMLAAQSIPHEFSMDGNLVVQSADEGQVEEVFEAWSQAVAEMEAGGGEFGPGLEGVHVPDLLGELFDLSGRVEQQVGDVAATRDLLAAIGRLAMLELPFGISREIWRDLLAAAEDLERALMPGEFVGDDERVAKIRSAAGRMRRLLADFV